MKISILLVVALSFFLGYSSDAIGESLKKELSVEESYAMYLAVDEFQRAFEIEEDVAREELLQTYRKTSIMHIGKAYVVIFYSRDKKLYHGAFQVEVDCESFKIRYSGKTRRF